MTEQIKAVMENLEKNNMSAFYAETKDDVLPIIKSLLPDGCSVSIGGSVTLDQCKVREFLENGNYNYLDRYDPSLDGAAMQALFVRALSADAYISSTNALTSDGKLYNVDGGGNRIGAICYGPKSVIIVAGKNKIVKDVDEAIKRVKTVAAPKNCVRLSRDTYCAKMGKCVAADDNYGGCGSDGRICSTYMVTSHQNFPGRIKVIIVNENLGY